jgi:hypothetical protein
MDVELKSLQDAHEILTQSLATCFGAYSVYVRIYHARAYIDAQIAAYFAD